MPGLDLERVFELKRAGDLDGAVIALEGMLGTNPHPAATGAAVVSTLDAQRASRRGQAEASLHLLV